MKLTTKRLAFAFSIGALLSFATLYSAHALDLKKIGAQLKQRAEEAKKNRASASSQPAAGAAPALAPSIICDSAAKNKLCYAFSGVENSVDKVSKGNEFACKMLKGRYLASNTCPGEKAHGRCTVLQGQPKEYTLYYYAGGRMSKDQAKSDCANPKSSIHAQGAGVWVDL